MFAHLPAGVEPKIRMTGTRWERVRNTSECMASKVTTGLHMYESAWTILRENPAGVAISLPLCRFWLESGPGCRLSFSAFTSRSSYQIITGSLEKWSYYAMKSPLTCQFSTTAQVHVWYDIEIQEQQYSKIKWNTHRFHAYTIKKSIEWSERLKWLSRPKVRVEGEGPLRV